MTKPLLALFAAALILGVTSGADAQRAQQQAQRISPDEVTRAADRLASQAERFASQAEGVGRYERVAMRAERFASQAEAMRHVVERRAPAQQRLMRDYAQLQREYHQLRADFFRANQMRPNRQLQRAWFTVALAHEALALAVGAPDPQRGLHERPRREWQEHDWDDWERDIRFR